MYDDPIVNLGVRLLSTNLDFFFNLSLFSLFFVFSIKLYYKKSSFEYLKIISLIIVFIFTLHFTLLAYIDAKREKVEDRIILVKSSSLEEADKKHYLNEAKKIIEILDSEKIKNINNMIFGAGVIMLWAIILIIFRDLFLQSILKKIKSLFIQKNKM